MMNFLIYSYNFLPQADAESYCATRFASALARAGHNVTVVTMDWPMQVSEKTFKALVAEELKIIRLPFSTKKNSPLKGLLWYGHKSQMAVDVPQSVKVVKTELRKMENPILITRTHPVMCTMVGLKTYKDAYKWIAHFSDPIPGESSYADTFGHKLLKRQEMNIIRKAFQLADSISVTCMHVCRYFKDLYGDSFEENKVFMTTHIGDYRLDAPPLPSDNDNIERILLHPGSIFAHRGGNAIIDVMNKLHEENFDCKFVQIGNIGSDMKSEFLEKSNIEIHNTISLEESVLLRKKAKAIFVPDFEYKLDYSPFILSKFVYQIMSDKPIVLYTKRDSEMHDYAEKFPEAGIFWAEEGNVESLKHAIVNAMNYDVTTIDRTQIRKCFSEKTIVESFLNSIPQ